MNQLNGAAFSMWVFGTSLGYTLGNAHGAAMGLAITSGICFVLYLFVK